MQKGQPLTLPRDQKPNRRGRGFQRASGLLAQRIRKAGESRGFAVSRLLTHWAEVVGEEIANMARPVKVSYGKSGFGATLTLLSPGSIAPLLQMRLPEIREKVNACYGYSAISHVRITQTAPQGFAEPAAPFEHRAPQPTPKACAAAQDMSADVADPGLRAALEALGQNVLSKN